MTRKALTEIDSGVLYDVLTLPHSLHQQDLTQLIPDVPVDYNGEQMYLNLKNNQTDLVTMLLEREAIINKVCSNGE